LHSRARGRCLGMRRVHESKTSRGGYTLVELMMVVAVIAASTLAFAPGIGRAVAGVIQIRWARR
jgi:prepilin-type N-terminal cleavage/methylation domain-containing protein